MGNMKGFTEKICELPPEVTNTAYSEKYGFKYKLYYLIVIYIGKIFIHTRP